MSWSTSSSALHSKVQYVSAPAASLPLFNPFTYGQRPPEESEARKRLVHPTMRLPPLRMTTESRPTQYRVASKMKIEDILSSADVDQHHEPLRRHEALLPAFPIVSRVSEPAAPQWDNFIARYAALPPVPQSTSRQQSHELSSEGLSSSASHMSSPSAMSTQLSYRLSPPVSPSVTTVTAPPYTYTLLFRQQPLAARACGHGDRDRRVIDPPPILELKITAADGAPVSDRAALFMVNCTLMDSETGKQAVSEDPDCRMANTLMGASAMSPFPGKDERGLPGTFFIFSDLSCRYQGRFRLHFELIRLDYTKMKPGEKHGIVATAETEVFTAFTAKDFPGMQASTPLLKALKRQGLTVSIKKGSEARKLKGKLKRNASYDGSESGESIIDLGKKKAKTSRANSPGSVGNKTRRRACELPTGRA